MALRNRCAGEREFSFYSNYLGYVQEPPQTGKLYTRHQALESTSHPERNAVFRANRRAETTARHVIDIGGYFTSASIAVKDTGLQARTVTDSIYFGNGQPWYETRAVFVPSERVKLALSLKRDRDTNDEYTNRILAAAPTPLSAFALDAAGTTAIARCMPNNPLVDLSSSLAEIASAKSLFSIPGKALKKGDIAGEYLNYMLGIAPVISDVKSTYEAAQMQETVLKQLERDSGRLVRRRYEFPEIVQRYETVEKDVYPATLGGVFNAYQVKPGTRTTSTTHRQKIWFSGAFTYYLPKKGWRKSLDQYHRLYGVKVGAETAWNVIPFSFVADYFANTGDMLHNYDAFVRDGLVMPYGYLMSQSVIEERTVWNGGLCKLGVPQNTVLSSTVTYSMKQRRRANPFGFGLNNEDLNPRQLSILAALGISRK